MIISEILTDEQKEKILQNIQEPSNMDDPTNTKLYIEE
jgi:hypothetical protein